MPRLRPCRRLQRGDHCSISASSQSGQRILIHGGSGGVGHFAVQFAKWKGAYVIATASTKNQELLRKLGADEAIDYTTQKFENVAHKIDIVLDTIGGETQERSWLVLKQGGALISLVQPPSEEKANQFGVRGIMSSVQPNACATKCDREAHRLSQA